MMRQECFEMRRFIHELDGTHIDIADSLNRIGIVFDGQQNSEKAAEFYVEPLYVSSSPLCGINTFRYGIIFVEVE